MTTAALLMLAFAAAAFGFVTTSQATLGAASIAMACFLGIVARLDQAARHQQQIAEWLGKLPNAPPYTPAPRDRTMVRDLAIVTVLIIVGVGLGGWVWLEFL